MAPLCASNQPHSVYPHISPPDPSLSALPQSTYPATVLHSSGPDAGPFVGLLVEAFINLSVIREEEGASKGGNVMQQKDRSFWRWRIDVEVNHSFI